MPGWFKAPFPLAVLSALGISSSTLAFYALETCFQATCPIRHAAAGAVPAALPAAVLRPSTLRTLAASLAATPAADTALRVFRCALQSEVAALALIVTSWCLALLALSALLALVVPRPKPAELDAYRTNCAFFAANAALYSVHVLAVSDRGYEDVATILAFWAWKFAAYQLHTLLPLRSEAVRRAAHVRLRALLPILATTAALAAAHAYATAALARAAPALPRVVFFELCSVALHALRFCADAATEALHVVDELASRRALLATDAAVPTFGNERRADAREAVDFAHAVVESTALLAHHVAALATFGFRFRVGDALLAYDVRHFSTRLLESWQRRLQRTLAERSIQAAFDTATAEEAENAQACAICHAALPRPGRGAALSQPKQLPCSHVFHLACLRRWIQHSEGRAASCPMCRESLAGLMATGAPRGWRGRVIEAIDWWYAWPWNHVGSLLAYIDACTQAANAAAAAAAASEAEPLAGTDTLQGAPATPRAASAAIRHAAAAVAQQADAAQEAPPTHETIRSRLRSAVHTASALLDPETSHVMLEGYLSVRESLQRLEGLYTVIGRGEAEASGELDGGEQGAAGASGHGGPRALSEPPEAAAGWRDTAGAARRGASGGASPRLRRRLRSIGNTAAADASPPAAAEAAAAAATPLRRSARLRARSVANGTAFDAPEVSAGSSVASLLLSGTRRRGAARRAAAESRSEAEARAAAIDDSATNSLAR